MGNIYTGSNTGKAGLEVTEVDGNPDVFGVSKIIVSNGTLTDNADGSVTITTGGGGGGGAGTVTSVQVSGGTTGLTTSGGPITGAGTITIDGTLVVANGGTGATSLTDGGILLGSGTGAITVTSQPTNGQLLIGSTGTDPVLATLTEGTNISITEGAGSIEIATTAAAYGSWTASDGGNTDAVNSGDTLTFTGGTGITATLSGTGTATPTLTIDADGTSPTGTGSAGQVTYWSGASTIAGDTGLTYTNTPGSRRLKLEDSSAGTMFEIVSTDAGAGSAPDIVFVRDSATPAAGDDLGVIVFKGNNDAPAEHEYARISSEANDITAGAEDGQLDFRVFVNGAIGQQLRIYEGGVYVNIANDAVTDFRVDTSGATDAFKVDASADTAEFNVNVLPFNIQQQTTGAAGLTITIDDDGATASPDLKLFHNSTTPLANDDLGHIHFQGRNSTPATVSYADVYADILDPTDTVEAGRFNFRVRAATNSGALTDMMSIRGDGNPCVVVNDSGRADVDFRVETDNQNSAFFMDASADTATFNVDVGIGTSPSSSLHVSTADNIIAKFLSTDATAAIELADNSTTNNAVLTRVGQTLTLCANGGNVAFGNSIGSYNGAPPTDGQLLIGDTASGVFDKATLTSSGGTITITNGAGTINLEAAGGGGGTPAGSDTEIQFNNAGAFGASSRLTFNSGTNAFTVGSALLTTPVNFSQSASNGTTQAGNITSNATTVSMELNSGFSTIQEIGVKQTTTKFQVETGKTTTQSFGQTEKIITGTGTYNCYPSEGGMIVVDDVAGAGAISLNLVLAQDPVGAYEANANPPNAAGGGTPVADVPDKAGYGTWQIGDQVTIVASYASGNTPAISVQSCTLLSDGVGGSGDPVLDPSRAAKINGVNSNSTPNTITTNYTAKTYILVTNISETLQCSWVAIG